MTHQPSFFNRLQKEFQNSQFMDVAAVPVVVVVAAVAVVV
jgi:hypothetical protein